MKLTDITRVTVVFHDTHGNSQSWERRVDTLEDPVFVAGLVVASLVYEMTHGPDHNAD